MNFCSLKVPPTEDKGNLEAAEIAQCVAQAARAAEVEFVIGSAVVLYGLTADVASRSSPTPALPSRAWKPPVLMMRPCLTCRHRALGHPGGSE